MDYVNTVSGSEYQNMLINNLGAGAGSSRMDWSELEAESLMTEYELHRCLWDPAHPNYHCNNQRTEAYFTILTTLGPKFTITDIKKKINSIRTQFNQVSTCHRSKLV